MQTFGGGSSEQRNNEVPSPYLMPLPTRVMCLVLPASWLLEATN